MRGVVITNPFQRAVNRLANGLDERKVRASGKPYKPCHKLVPVACGDKPGNRRTVLGPAQMFGGFAFNA